MALTLPASLILLALLSTAPVSEAHDDCYASVGGSLGHVYPFDGGHVLVDPVARGCQHPLLITQSESSNLCQFKILASFAPVKRDGGKQLARLSGLAVLVDGHKYELLTGRRLAVNGHPKPPPYDTDAGLRVFYSGEDLVLVHRRCRFWVTYDGHWTATLRLGGKYHGGKVSGLAGNCNGHQPDDSDGASLSKWLALAKCAKPSKDEHHRKTCHNHSQKAQASAACKRVINGRGGCQSLEVLHPCITDFCAAMEGGHALSKRVVCASFYLHSRRCARTHQPLAAWRHNSGCALQCSANAHFVPKANPCPETCGSHFFGAPKRCFHLPSAEGCRCKPGFVLDHNRCVRPKHCRCLTKLCADRLPRDKCLRWRAHGRCQNYPALMASFCRLTCGMCRLHCRNQFSEKMCAKIRSEGKCHKSFYRAACPLTCTRDKCHCPASSRKISKCSHQFKHRTVTSLHWFRDHQGKCMKSALVKYEPCGFCPPVAKTFLSSCNYCTGIRVGKRVVQHREAHGKRRCLRRVHRFQKPCVCPAKVSSGERCERDTVTVRTVKAFKASLDCKSCSWFKRRSIVKKIHCSGRRVVLPKCKPGHHYRTRRVYRKFARDCACHWRLAHQQRLLCRCRRPHSSTFCSSRGDSLVTVTHKWLLIHSENRCAKVVKRRAKAIDCPERRHVRVVCNKESCLAVRHRSWFSLKACKCFKKRDVKHLGKCCCPSGYEKTVRVDKYWKKHVRVEFKLVDHHCKKRITVRKIRVACPNSSSHAKCDGKLGAHVFTKVWFILKGNCCVKKRLRREAKTVCRKGVDRHAGSCDIHHGATRFRHVHFAFSRRKPGTCRCIRHRRTVKEFCGCQKGKFVAVKPCPAHGCNSDTCGAECHVTKTYFYFAKRFGEEACHKRVFKQLRYPCCCQANKRVKRWCKSGKHKVRQVSFTVLKAHECHRVRRSSSHRVRCRHGPNYKEVKKLPHSNPHHYYLATYRWHVANCHCKVRISKRVCLKRCHPAKKARFCDHLRRDWVTRRVSWHLKGCRTCVRKVAERRSPVRCSQKVTRLRHCDAKSGVLTLTALKWKPKACGCIRVRRSRHLRCKCPKAIVGKTHCKPEIHAFVRHTVYWVLRHGHCVKRRKTRSTHVECRRSVRYRRVCKHKSGVLTVYVGVLKIDGCRCIRVWSVHNRLRCNCKRENHSVKHYVRHFCDRKRNMKATVRHYYILRDGCCVRRSHVSRRHYSCPPAYVEKRQCDLKRRQQVTLKHYSVKRHCRCLRAVKRWAKKCGCPGPKLEHTRFCRKVLGVIVSVTKTQRWSHRRERCILKSVTRSHRVACSQRVHLSVSKCYKNKFYVETKVFHERIRCHCEKRIVKRKKNCHCKTIVRRFKCPPPKSGRYTRRIVTQIMRWHAATKRCRTVHFVTRRVRCRCPSPRHRKFCHSGAWVSETKRFVLRHKQCYESVVRRQQMVHCVKAIRHRYTACHGCKKRHVYTLERRLDHKRCACYFAVVKRHSCPCCCPEPVVTKHCSHSTHAWVRTVVSHSALDGKKCGCQRHVKRHVRRVVCPKHRKYSWLPCDRHACLCKQQVEFSVAHKCGCRKVRELTGKHRVCCCHEKPKRSRFCRGSAIHERVITVHLKHWRCVKRKSVHLVRWWKCSPKPKVVIGKCDHSTCHQPLHTLVRRVDHPHCRCHRVAVHHRSRPCCCLKKPYKRHYCDAASAAWVTVKVAYGFDHHRRVCVRRRREIRSPVSCPQSSRHVLPCNRHSCRRPILHVSFSIKKCHCQRKVKRTSRICCCPPPEAIPPRCVHSHHEWLHGRVTWHLKKGHCVKRVTTVRRRMVCAHKKIRRIHACNRHTCRQTITKKYWRLKGCHCVVVRRKKQRTCCCRPAKRTKTRCERHRDTVKYTTLRYLDRSVYECRTRHLKHLLHRLKGCSGYERWGKCNHKTRHRLVKLVLRRPRHCRCKVYRKSTRRVLCSCPEPYVKRSKCSKASCHRTIVHVWFTSHGKRDHFHCRKHRRVTRLRCCCKKNPGSHVFCDRHSGAIKRKDWWTVFVSSSRSCAVRDRISLVKPLRCHKIVCHVSKCSKITGYKVRTCTSFVPDRHNCGCRKRVARRSIICHCPPSHSKSFCQHDKRRVHIHTKWWLSLRRNCCVKTVKRVIKHLVCSSRRWRVKKCHSRHEGCGGVWLYHKFRLRDCTCVRVTRSHPIKCCCPKPVRVTRCLGDQWLTVWTRFKLRSGHCVKLVTQHRRSIPCQRLRVRIGHCAEDCKKRRYTWHYKVKHCKCSLIKRRVNAKKCCCPRPRRYKYCDKVKGLFKRVKMYWHLYHGKCLKRRRVISHKVVCSLGWTWVGKCNHKTRHQKVKRVIFHRIGCKCHKRIRVLRLLCRCRPPVVIKEKCKHKMWKRRVFRLAYRLAHPHSLHAKCIKRRRLWYVEPCRCPKPTRQRRCSKDGSFVITCIRFWRLKVVWLHHHKQRVCVRRTTIKHRVIHCPELRIHWSRCHGCQKRRTIVKYAVRGCKCWKRVLVRAFACNCGKKSFRRSHCDAEFGQVVHTSHACFALHGAAKCSCHTRHRYTPIVCHRNPRKVLLTEHRCGLHKRHACFSQYSISWRVRRGCKCVRRHRTVTKFCRCHPGRRQIRCALDGRTIVRTHDFYRPYTHNHHVKGCKHVRQVAKHPVLCHTEGRHVRIGGCNAHCHRSIVVTQCLVKHCRRVKCIRTGLQLCCVPPHRKRHFCDKKNGRWVHETVTHKLVPSVPLVKDCHGHIVAHQKKVTSKTHRRFVVVHCPKSFVRETCDRESGLWRKRRVTWHRIACHCQRRLTEWRGKCKCPPKRVHWSKCKHRHQTKTVTWFVLHHHACKRHVRRQVYLCACPKPYRYTVCDRHGAWKTCRISFELHFHEQRCQKLRECHRRLHTCPAAIETRGHCVDCHRQIRHVSWRLNHHKCSCHRVVHRRVAECDCWKKKSRATACLHGAFVTKIVTHRQRGEKCVKFVKTITRPVSCSSHRVKRSVPGSCVRNPHHPHSGYKKVVTEWRERHGCKCIRKRRYTWVPCVCHLIKGFHTRKSVKCHGCTLVHTKIYFVLKHKSHKCHKRVRKHFQKTVCKGVKTHRGPCKPNKYGDTHSTTRVWKRHCDGKCGCVWRIAAVHRHLCHCRPSRHAKLCYRGHIWRRVHVTFHPVHGSLTCRTRRRTHDKILACPGQFTRRTKCHRCGFAVHKFAYSFKHCHCVSKLISTHHLRCCCPRPKLSHHCDAKRHLFVSTTVSHHLVKHRCHKRRVVRSHRVHCGERDKPHYRVTKCHKGWRKITKTVRFIVGCKCHVRTTHHKQRCACPHQLLYRKGKCGHWFALDVWLGWHLKDTGVKIPGTNKPKMKCVRVVVERRKRRCRCPKPYHRVACHKDDRWVKVSVSYHLHGNSCQRKRVIRVHRIPCHRHPRLVKVTVTPHKCVAKHGYEQTTKHIYVHAKHCKCHKTVRAHRSVCNCLLKHGGKKHSVGCHGPDKLVKKVVWFVHHGHHCVKRVKTSTKVLKCDKKRRVRASHCHPTKKVRVFSFYQQVIKHCKCVWVLFKRLKAPCKCPKTTRVKRCHKDQWVTTKVGWKLVGKNWKAHCVKWKKRTAHLVPCHGAGKRIVKMHGCNHFGYRITKIVFAWVAHCRCMRRVEHHKCRCRCPKDRVKKFCHKQAWVTVHLRHHIKKCACVGLRKVNRVPVPCPKRTFVRGKCVRAHNGDKYRKLIWTSWHGSSCRCKKHRVVHRHLCACDRRPHTRRTCVAGCLHVSLTTERHLIKGHCRRIRVHRRTVQIRCKRPSIRRVCDKKTGKLSIFIVRSHTKHCKCFRTVTKHTRRCGCHKGHKLVHIGKCNRHSCRQRLYFKKQVLDHAAEACIWKRYHKHRICCCHGDRTTVRCVHKMGYHEKTRKRMVLKHWHCVKRVTKKIKIVKCPRQPTHRSHRLHDGVLKLVHCWKVRRGCDCVKRCKTVWRRYSCKKPTKKVTCQCSGGRCRIVTCLTHWRLSDGHCFRQTRYRVQPTVCAPDRHIWSQCNLPTKYGFYMTKQKESWYQSDCQCHKRTHTVNVVCRCWKPHERTFCEKKPGEVVTVKVSYHLKRGCCVKSVSRRSRKIHCGHHDWRFTHRTASEGKHGVYFKVYARWVRHGCHCAKEHKRSPCRDRCPKCKHSKRCSASGNEIVIKKTCWHLSGCHCIRRVTTRRQVLQCPKSTRHSSCNSDTCKVTTVVKSYHLQACSCIATKHVSRHRKCCCPGPQKTRKCLKHSGVIRTRVVKHHLSDGKCFANTIESRRQVTCPKELHHVISGPCKHGKQHYSVHYWTRRGCKCVQRVRRQYRKCACEYKVVELIVAVDLHSKKGDQKHYGGGVMKFLDALLRHFKYGTTRVHTTLLAFNRAVKFHEAEEHHKIALDEFTNSQTDLHGALKAVHATLRRSVRDHKHVKKIVLIVTRGNHHSRRRCIALAEKIQRKAQVFVVGFGPLPESGGYVKWLASKPRRLHYIQLGVQKKYSFSTTRILEHACRRKRCPRSQRHVGSCKPDTCKHLVKLTTWYRDHHTGKCRQHHRVHSVACCCLGRDSNRLVCHAGRLTRIIVRHEFDHVNKICQRRVRRIDASAPIYASCQPAKRLIHGVCDTDGWCQDKQVTRWVDSETCRCREKSSLLPRVRCRCPPGRHWRQCRSGHDGKYWFHVRCQVTFHLSKQAVDGCAERRKCHRRQVICHEQSHSFRGKCNHDTCKRRLGHVSYTVDHCRCQRKVKVWSKICCCKQSPVSRSYCGKSGGAWVHVTTRHRLTDGACLPVHHRVVSPVPCPKEGSHLEVGQHCHPHGQGFYRKVTRVEWHLQACKCKRETSHHGWRLCHCRKQSRTTTKCLAGRGIVATTLHWLAPQDNHCVWRSKVTHRVSVTCSVHKRLHIGECHHTAEDGKKYQMVTQNWQTRKGCKCKDHSHSHKRLCGCPKHVRRVTRCHSDHLVTTSLFHYRLSQHGKHAECTLIRRVRRHYVTCRWPRIVYAKKCHNKKKHVSVTVFRPSKCRCHAKVYRRIVSCKSSCQDILPTKICQKWAESERVDLCQSHRHIAMKVCAKTCRLCCKRPSIVFSGHSCLANHHPHGHDVKKLLLSSEKTTFHGCYTACRKNPHCRSFDYQPHTGSCQLLRVSPDDVKHLTPVETPGCLLFVKSCATAQLPHCPFRRVVKSFSCRCAHIFGKRSHPLCYRQAIVAVYQAHHTDLYGFKCKRHLVKLRLPCKWCDDSHAWCPSAASEGKCKSSGKVRRLCPHSCQLCKRHQAENLQRRHVGRCNAKTGSELVATGGLLYDKHVRLWRVRAILTQRTCVTCPVGSRLDVTRCSAEGKRRLTYVHVALEHDGKCKVGRRTQVVDCHGCGAFDINRSVGQCTKSAHDSGWTRKVTVRFTVRESDKCVVQSHSDWFGCSPKCPRRSVVRESRCVCGKQVVCTRYYVTFPEAGKEAHRCVPREVRSSRGCVGGYGAACSDKLSEADCSKVKHSGLCKSLHSVCSRTCGTCN